MPIERTCPRCGTALSADALDGLCPTCVGRAAFDNPSAMEPISPELAEQFARLKPEEAGDQIGNYKLLQQIGEGGFGTVWMAEQERPVRRRVALKVIKLGMDTKEVIARFEQERQALAMMDHPNIAKVFDAGATQFGRPFFVMELVRGIKITDYCDRANLPTTERLALFILVCHAVQHAHQKGIIHRDLKPSNVLVTMHDGVPVPKVIDFGVAKATQQQRLTDLTLFTQFEQMIGTPLYMSPEQAEMSGLDIDTRSDIYSLGVLLYELLTGRTPFDPEELMQKGLDEIRRTIREQEPLTPSMFVKTMGAERRATVAQHRQSDPGKLTDLLRGDLDWIVMKALEKDRTRRYETAVSFAQDIERHLASEPVHARPTSSLYRFRRLVKRNKLVVSAVLAIAAALFIGSGISIWQAMRAQQEAWRANKEATAAQSATREAQKAEAAATENLWRSYLETARASVRTHDAGRRFKALEAIEKAAKIRTSPELRDVAASALMLADIQRTSYRPRDWERENHEWGDYSGDLKSYTYLTDDGHAVLRRTADDTLLGSLDSPAGAERCPWLNDDATLIAVRGRDHVMRVRRWSDGATLLEVPGTRDAAWHPSGGRIAISGYKSIDEYSLTSGACLKSVFSPNAHKIAYSPDGSQMAAIEGDRGQIIVYDTASGAVEQVIAGENLDSLAWHPKQAILAASGNPQRVSILNAKTGQLMKSWTSEGGHITSLAFSLDGGSLITAGWDTHVRVWNWQTADLLVSAVSSNGDELRVSPDGRQIVTRNWFNSDSSLYDLATPGAVQTLAQEPHGSPHSAIFDPKGRWLAVCEDDALSLWAADGKRQLARFYRGEFQGARPHAVAFHPTKTELAVAHSGGLTVFSLRENPDNTCRLDTPHVVLENVHGDRVAFSRDGSLGAVVANGTCHIYETETWTLRAHTPAIGGEWLALEFSRDGRWITGSVWGHGTYVWDASTGAEIFHARDVGSRERHLTPDQTAFIADLTRLHSYQTDTWQIAEPASPEIIATTLPRTFIFSPDGTVGASGLIDRVRIARWPSYETLLELNVIPDPRINGLAFSPDNNRLLVVGALGRVELVDLGALRGELAKLGLGW